MRPINPVSTNFIPTNHPLTNNFVPNGVNSTQGSGATSSDVKQEIKERLGIYTPEQMMRTGSKSSEIEDKKYGQTEPAIPNNYTYSPTSVPTSSQTNGQTQPAIPNSPTSVPTSSQTNGQTQPAIPNNYTYPPTSVPTSSQTNGQTQPAIPNLREKDDKNLLEIILGVFGGVAVIGASALAYFKLKRGEGNAAPENEVVTAPTLTAANYEVVADIELGNTGLESSSQNNSPSTTVQNANVGDSILKDSSKNASKGSSFSKF